MENKEQHYQDLNSKLEKYKKKISIIDKLLKNHRSHDKEHLISEINKLKGIYQQAEDIFQTLAYATEENYEEIKKSSIEIFEILKKSSDQFSHLLTMGQLSHMKEEIRDFGNEKLSEIEEYAKEKPFTCAAGAFGVGLLVGAITVRVR